MKAILLSSLFFFSAQAADSQYYCFPEVDRQIPAPNRFAKFFNQQTEGIVESDYYKVLDKFESIWSPIVYKKYNKKLIVKKAWDESRINAHATRDDANNPVIVINGGLARHEEMTKDGLFLILCHELGHHFGGAPKSFRGSSKKRSWSSAEGQADYFATNKCMPRLIAEGVLDKTTSLKDLELKRCSSVECKQIAPAALSVGKLFATLKNEWKMPSLDKKDSTSVYRTNYKHPVPQCRVDTFIAGILCSREYEVDFDNNDYKIGSCLVEELPEAARPSCWFSSDNY